MINNYFGLKVLNNLKICFILLIIVQTIVVSGSINRIGSPTFSGGSVYCSDYSSIVGGCANNIDSCSGCLSSYGFIGGGCANYICTGASFSAILGGGGNTVPAGCSYVGIFGCNINNPLNITNCAFHANNFVAQNLPIGSCPLGGPLVPPVGAKPGSFWYWPDTWGNKMLFAV